jgi:O-antigen ligase
MKNKIRINSKSGAWEERRVLTKRDSIYGKIIEYGILGLIIFSPLPAASVEAWSILVIQLTVLVMMAAYFLMREKPQNNEFLSLSLKWPKYLFLGLFVFIFIQIIPLPKFLVKVFSPNTYSFQSLLSTDFPKIKFMSLSVVPSHTLREGLELLSYFLLGFLIVKTVTNRRQIMRIFSVLIAMGIFEAFYGMFELYSKNPRILFYRKIDYLDSLTGTFVNRNHLSGYLEMIIPLALGLIIARIDLFSPAGLRWRSKLLRLSEKGLSTNLLITLGIIIMSLAIIFSKSRSGVFLLVFLFILFFGLTVLYYGRAGHQRKGIKNFLKVVFLIVIFVSFYIGIGTTLERFAPDKLLQEQRPAFWANTIGIVTEFPFFGTGLGTFPYFYPDYEESGIPMRLFHAHNDYLEYLSELGGVGLILLLGGILLMAINSFLVWRVRRHPEVKGLALGGIVAIICILIHSITDFNLQIPANMMLFSVVLSLTIVIAFYKRRETNNQ